jgi:diacylglycerol kinase (ATP)
LVVVGYEGENLAKVLARISSSQVVKMDRWLIEFSKPEPGDAVAVGDAAACSGDKNGDNGHGDPIPCNIINNYFSIGVVR